MKTLVLDIGGIFFQPSWRLEGIAHTSQMFGISRKDFKEALDQDKRLFYTGQISERKYWDTVIRKLNAPLLKSEDLESIYRSYVQPISETLALLPKLASRYRLVACNNCPKEWMEYRVRIASLDSFFSKRFTSGYVGSMKPEENMYSKVFMGEENREDIVYIDDNENYTSFVRERYGVQSIVYKKPEDLSFWIR